ncbi:hypothetical protein KY289_007518 [Solanum tuberosum]|nr:hypothetical protein KY289_007518 [Solanum tuberosum]
MISSMIRQATDCCIDELLQTFFYNLPFNRCIHKFLGNDHSHPASNKTLGQDFTIGLVLNKVPIPPHSNNHKLIAATFTASLSLKKPTKLTLWEDFIDHEGVKLFNQLHDYPIILARRIGKSSSGTSNRFVGLTSKFNTTIEINPPYPQAAELRPWIKTIETKLVAYKMKSTTPIGSIMLILFEDEVISVANIQAQPPGQVFNVEVELSLASKDQRFSVLACSNCKQLFTRYNVRREIYCTSCHQSTHLIPRCQFEVTIKDNNGFATAIVSDEIAKKMLHLTSEEIYEIFFIKKETLSLKNVEDQLNGKIFNIQMKRLFTKKMDATQKLFILSYLEKQDLEHFCCGSRNGHFLHCFSAAIECRVLQASDVAMWMPCVPLLLWKLKIFSPVIADKACVIVSSHAIAQPLFHHCSVCIQCGQSEAAASCLLFNVLAYQ